MKERNKKKIGRNDPCPCGSGVKYKKCCGKLTARPSGPIPEQIRTRLMSHESAESRRQSQQGKGKPIISTEFQGYRFTAVGSRLHYSKRHKTFIDFLGDYIRSVLDPKWGNAEIGKPLKDRHQILQWYDAICTLQRTNMKRPNGEIQDMPMNGLLAAYYGLAYNLYLLQHNAELQKYLIRRLKRSESFYAAYYETYVAAWFILAGFTLRMEDEQDSTRSHPEFIATRDGKSYSVEAKTRQPGKEHYDVGNQLYAGLCIQAHYPRVIFIDMNAGVDADFNACMNGALAAIKGREPTLTIKGAPAPSAHVYVTNQPYHLALYETRLPVVCLAAGFKIPDFGHGAPFRSYTEAYKARMKYAALNDVQKAIVSYKIPETFDGELPEFAFGKAKRRFTIGERFEVAEGIFVTLQSGVVAEPERRAYLVVSDDAGKGHIMTAELSDSEMEAYRSHPETFFGRIVQVSQKAEDPMDLYTFFFNGCKETSREKLLEFMRGAPDLEELKKLPEDELRYAYAERLTHSAMRDKKK
jgi:hypothetical protein